MEPNFSYEYMGKEEGERLDKRCRIHVHSRRTRLADADGVSAKAVIDGLVKAGLLANDSPECVKEVSYSQDNSKNKDSEETIIDLYF